MNIYLLRHGIAIGRDDPSSRNDADRPLTAKGLKRMRKAARGLRRLNIPFDAVVTSPFTRARQTADIVVAALELQSTFEEMSDLTPESSVETLLSNLARFQNHSHLLLVGHEPLLSDLAAFLLTLEHPSRLGIGLRKGGLCRIEVDALPPPQRGTLHWLMTPKQLRQFAPRHAK
ncbi:MAG: phosphohistidine phosphatase SixA [Candidatus Binatia bacterium]